MLKWQRLEEITDQNVLGVLAQDVVEEVITILYAKKAGYEFYIITADNGGVYYAHHGHYAVNLIALNIPEAKRSNHMFKPKFCGNAYLQAVKCVFSDKEEKEYIKRYKQMVEEEFFA